MAVWAKQTVRDTEETGDQRKTTCNRTPPKWPGRRSVGLGTLGWTGAACAGAEPTIVAAAAAAAACRPRASSKWFSS
jgi:hypothetical protein